MTRPSGDELAAVGVHRQVVGEPGLLARLVDGVELVRRRLVRAEDAEVVGVALQDVAQELAEPARVLGFAAPGFLTAHRVVAEVGQPQRPCAAGRRWRAGWRSCAAGPSAPAPCSSATSRPVRVEQFLRPVALQPLLEQLQVRRVVAHVGHRHLVRAPVALDRVCRRPSSARSSPWGCAARSSASAARSALPLRRASAWMRADVLHAALHGRRHQLVHRRRGRRPRRSAASSRSRGTARRVPRARCARGSSGC